MQTLRLSTGAAALAVGSLAVFGMAGPALADHNCPNPAEKYPPGQCEKEDKDRGHEKEKDKEKNKDKKAVSDDNAQPGQPVAFEVGGWKEGEKGKKEFHSKPVSLGTFVANDIGVASGTFTVPKNASSGQHNFVLIGESGRQVSIPVTVSRTGEAGGGVGAGSNAGTGTPSSLPFTGSGDLIPLTIVGVGMVALGAGVVVAARRRRSELDVTNVA